MAKGSRKKIKYYYYYYDHYDYYDYYDCYDYYYYDDDYDYDYYNILQLLFQKTITITILRLLLRLLQLLCGNCLYCNCVKLNGSKLA